ncbi:lysosome-associated membrane glycoprotein 2 isoform X1 [Varanus komodoensis]|uniref:Lysosome-associated membrane glycoprotein 2 n=2 Tax=Varanus komodoensis TaxID=61221 RepID=A0A8D2L680_VARKO|nr:lysosome-associated membrane glycoprotein 2 isoform X1 [Varanus komodoensis]XP_044283336.1 lysosome-associated membrane glycoprotein 2 isoform X1 [Varanus komodoensis]
MKPRCAAAAAAARPGLLLPGLLLLGGSVLLQTCAMDVEMKDASNVTCLYAKWMMNLSITYESEANLFKTTTFPLPDPLSYDGSSCGNDTYGPVLAIKFGDGHSWAIHFMKTNTYQGRIFITYNTNDTELFPDAKRKGLITISANYPIRPVKLNTRFVCNNVETIEAASVKQDFWNVTLEAFPEDGFLSNKETLCDKDTPSTPAIATVATAPDTTSAATTHSSAATTHSSAAATDSSAAATDSSTAAVTTPPSAFVQTVEKPGTGYYMVKNGSTACLLANVALQLNISQKEPLVYNINPNTTVATGSCGKATSVLELIDGKNRLTFLFAVKTVNSEKFYLKEVNITVSASANETLSAANRSLSYWEASLGSAYMCKSEETIAVSPTYKINVFNLKIQPFEVEDNEFSAAEECNPDVDNYFVPIMVGAALAGLIFLVLMAYFVGRKTHRNAGYEQF